MNLPKIIILGVIKGGTTALWYNLDKHPDISMAKRKKEGIGMHFWGGRNWERGFDWYCNKFEEGKIGGEKSIGYWKNKKSIKQIIKHVPDARLFLCVRNPVDRAYSHYQMHQNKNKNKVFNHKEYFGEGLYINKIENNILPFVGKDQLHLCIAEHMKKDPTTGMCEVFKFIGVEDLNLPKKVIDGVLRRYRNREEDIEVSRKEPFYRVWDRWSAKGRLEGPERKKLLEMYKPYNERLFDFLGYEIEEWKE